MLKELKMIAMLRGIATPGDGEGWLWACMRLHLIKSDLIPTLGASSKLNAEWEFLTLLRDEGRRAATAFGDEHGEAIGHRATYDIGALLDGI
jgi:NTE family protein